VLTEVLVFHRKKKSKKKEGSDDDSDAEEHVVWMEKKSKSMLFAVHHCSITVDRVCFVIPSPSESFKHVSIHVRIHYHPCCILVTKVMI